MRCQFPDKKTPGIPPDIYKIRSDIEEIFRQTIALVQQGKLDYEVFIAELTAYNNQITAAERRRVEAEERRQREHDRRFVDLRELKRKQELIIDALNALGRLHDEHDYMVIVDGLLMSERVFKWDGSEAAFLKGTYEEGHLVVEGGFYGLES